MQVFQGLTIVSQPQVHTIENAGGSWFLDKITKSALFFQCIFITKLLANYCHNPLNPPLSPFPNIRTNKPRKIWKIWGRGVAQIFAKFSGRGVHAFWTIFNVLLHTPPTAPPPPPTYAKIKQEICIKLN